MVKNNVYVGQRYVPKIMGEWLNTNTYEGLSIVTHQGTSYTSKKRVPVGIDISNEEYWVVTGNYNAQIEQYREEVKQQKENLENFEEVTNTQLVQITSIDPDDFEGTDIEKVQQAIDYHLEQGAIGNFKHIKLYRMFDLTGGSINFNSGYKDFMTIIESEGGGLIKNDAGFMFSSTSTNNHNQLLNFIKVRFQGNGTSIVVDADKIICLHFNNCFFNKMEGAVKADLHYIQTLRFINNVSFGHSDYLIQSNHECYDIVVEHNQIESGKGLFKVVSSVAAANFAIRSLNINTNVIENQTGVAIVLDSAMGLSIKGNYFEGNLLGDISFIDTIRTINTRAITIRDNHIYGGGVPFVKGLNTSSIGNCYIDFRNNVANKELLGTIKSSVTIDYEGSTNYAGDVFSFDSKEFPFKSQNTVADTVGSILSSDENGHLRFTVEDLLYDPLYTAIGKSFLVDLNGNYTTNDSRKSSYVGILTLVGGYSSVLAKDVTKIMLSPIVNTGVGAHNDTAIDISVTWKSTGTNECLTTWDRVSDDSIVLDCSNLVFHKQSLKIIPLESILRHKHSIQYRK